MTVLVVDDNPAIRRMIARIVGDVVDEIRECEDGAGALAAYRETSPDLVFMDIEMKGVDGISATRQIVAAFPDARIVIVTEHDGEPIRAAARAAGACGYVSKENLLELRRWLESEP